MENNNIKLVGVIKEIEPSHTSNDKNYMKAIIEVDSNNKTYNIPIKFRADTYDGVEDVEVAIQGNLRSYSKQLYVYTKFDLIDKDTVISNSDTHITGVVVKKDEKYNSIVINIDNTYVPVKTSKNYEIGTVVTVEGEFIERKYSKRDTTEQFSTFEIIERVN